MILTPAKTGLNMKIARRAVAVLNVPWQVSGYGFLTREGWITCIIFNHFHVEKTPIFPRNSVWSQRVGEACHFFN